MKFVLFYHSLISDWNHGNAHFLRGVATELLQRGHSVEVYEPTDGWSLRNLRAEPHPDSLMGFFKAYPQLLSRFYTVDDIDIGAVLANADVVIVHEWNDPALIQKIGRHRARSGHYLLLFHDTHHRAVTDPKSIARYDLEHFDGVLAFGNVLRDIYLDRGWAARAWTWHEAADTRVFRPMRPAPEEGDLIWIGNWGDDERTRELEEFLFDPVKALKLRARVYGVRYPEAAREALSEAGIEYGGWLPNYEVPRMFARFKVTVHIPRRPYCRALPGIPTIRPFEALACGIPLVCAPWDDVEELFAPGRDFLVARTRRDMKDAIGTILHDRKFARTLAERGRAAVLRRHTCAHRVDELLDICRELRLSRSAEHTPRKESAVT
ncbi:CgeB family protein [Methylocaldum sp. MU1018]